jgi:hypothetical protein
VDSPASVFCIAIGHCIGKVINALMTVTVLAGS